MHVTRGNSNESLCFQLISRNLFCRIMLIHLWASPHLVTLFALEWNPLIKIPFSLNLLSFFSLLFPRSPLKTSSQVKGNPKCSQAHIHYTHLTNRWKIVTHMTRKTETFFVFCFSQKHLKTTVLFKYCARLMNVYKPFSHIHCVV